MTRQEAARLARGLLAGQTPENVRIRLDIEARSRRLRRAAQQIRRTL